MSVSRTTLVLPVLILSIVLLLTIASGQSAHKGQSQIANAHALTPDDPGTEPVQLHITVTGKDDDFVNGLQQNHFEILVEKTPAKIVSFQNQDAPTSIGIVFDSSGSVRNASQEKTRRDFLMVREAIGGFLKQSNTANEYFLLGFNVKPQLLSDWTSDHSKLLDAFNHLTIFGNTAFYDSSYVAVDKLMTSRHAKRVLLLIGDGQDNLSHYTFKELRELIRNTGVIVYTICFSGRPDYLASNLGEEGKSILRELSVASGGRVYLNDGHPIKPKEMSTVLEKIANELRHQYSLSIVPGEPGGVRKWRKIKTVVKPDSSMEKIRTRTREGFYSGRPTTN
ncbi:MAG TPA: VWA domain-containing protein [Pyrinomonadaceae bacterium]|nr:VWA domain-containing protein [Pyrinomonadaceae bacterium]